ncbi:unnamed protein product, partial [Oikopleura dioica]
SSMLESPAEPDRASEKARPNSDDDEEFKRVLEISQQEEREKQAILDCLNKSDEDNVDTNKKPDPPPTPISVPTQSSPVPTVSFAQQAKTGGNFQQPASEPLPVSQLRSQVEIKDGYNLYVMRGLPGSGKSTLAKSMVKSYNDAGKKGVICSADDFFIDNRGKYNFDMTRLSEAHEHCRLKADQFMALKLLSLTTRTLKYGKCSLMLKWHSVTATESLLKNQIQFGSLMFANSPDVIDTMFPNNVSPS